LEEDIKNEFKDSFDDTLKSKIRRFELNSKPDGTRKQKKLILDLYKDGNSNNDKSSFNGKNKFN
jgi:hypothetical protein